MPGKKVTYEELLGIGKPMGETEKVVSELGESPINVYSHEIATDSKPVGKTKIDYNKIPEKVVKYNLDMNFNSDDIRYFFQRITGKTWRGNDADCYNELLFHLHGNKEKFIQEWKIRKEKWDKQFGRLK